jgi:hypothetical protein
MDRDSLNLFYYIAATKNKIDFGLVVYDIAIRSKEKTTTV